MKVGDLVEEDSILGRLRRPGPRVCHGLILARHPPWLRCDEASFDVLWPSGEIWSRVLRSDLRAQLKIKNTSTVSKVTSKVEGESNESR
jgi:hypothetical protein